MTDHNQDLDCTVESGACIVCGVGHGYPCEACGGAGFHKDACPEIDPKDAEERALAAKFPVGARVRIIGSDLEEYAGLTGVVRDYDFSDEPSLIGVAFDVPVQRIDVPAGSGPSTRDGFYDDELVLLDAPACDGCGGPLGPDARDGERGCYIDSDGGVWTEAEDENDGEDDDIARLLAEKEKAYAVFMSALDASNAAQNHMMRTRDAYLTAAEQLCAAEHRST